MSGTLPDIYYMYLEVRVCTYLCMYVSGTLPDTYSTSVISFYNVDNLILLVVHTGYLVKFIFCFVCVSLKKSHFFLHLQQKPSHASSITFGIQKTLPFCIFDNV